MFITLSVSVLSDNCIILLIYFLSSLFSGPVISFKISAHYTRTSFAVCVASLPFYYNCSQAFLLRFWMLEIHLGY